MLSALTITMQEQGRLLMGDQNACRFYDDIFYLDEYEGLVLDKDTAQPIGDACKENNIVFLANHGVIVTGETIHEAWESLYYLEKACKAQNNAMSTGIKINPIKGQIAKKVSMQIKEEAKSESANSFRHFEALKRILIKNGNRDFLN